MGLTRSGSARCESASSSGRHSEGGSRQGLDGTFHADWPHRRWVLNVHLGNSY